VHLREFKYGMTIRGIAPSCRRPHYLELAARVSALAERKSHRTIRRRWNFTRAWVTRWRRDSMACAAKDAPRRERGRGANTCSERPQSMRTSPMRTLDSAYTTIHRHAFGAARVLRFFMGIPGGSKKEGSGSYSTRLQRAYWRRRRPAFI